MKGIMTCFALSNFCLYLNPWLKFILYSWLLTLCFIDSFIWIALTQASGLLHQEPTCISSLTLISKWLMNLTLHEKLYQRIYTMDLEFYKLCVVVCWSQDMFTWVQVSDRIRGISSPGARIRDICEAPFMLGTQLGSTRRTTNALNLWATHKNENFKTAWFIS